MIINPNANQAKLNKKILKGMLKTTAVIQNTLMWWTYNYDTPQVNNICSKWLLKYDDIDPVYRHFKWLLSKDKKIIEFGSNYNNKLVIWETIKVKDIQSIKTADYKTHCLVCTQDNRILLLDIREQLNRPEIIKYKNLIQLIKNKLN